MDAKTRNLEERMKREKASAELNKRALEKQMKDQSQKLNSMTRELSRIEASIAETIAAKSQLELQIQEQASTVRSLEYQLKSLKSLETTNQPAYSTATNEPSWSTATNVTPYSVATSLAETSAPGSWITCHTNCGVSYRVDHTSGCKCEEYPQGCGKSFWSCAAVGPYVWCAHCGKKWDNPTSLRGQARKSNPYSNLVL